MEHFRFCPCLIVLIHVFLCISSCFVHTEGFDSLLELPRSRSNRTRPGSKRVLYLGDFGANGDGLNDDTEAFAFAWRTACYSRGRRKVVLPSGYTFLIRRIDLAGPCKSKVTLQISGTIVAPRDPDAWEGLDNHKWIYFDKVNHLTLEGGGTVNGMGQEWWARSCKVEPSNPCRHAPTAITFHRCKNLIVNNLMVVNSQQMHMAFSSCRRVAASNLQVLAPATSPNTDGIHISRSHGVEVMDSTVRTGDDCVSIVSNSSRVNIKNIVCGPGHGISIGSLGDHKSWAEVHDVSVDGAVISDSENGLRIKTWQGGGGYAANIKFENVVMVNVSNPIIIDQYYCDSRHPCANQTSAVKVKNISYKHIKGTSASEEAIRFACSESSPCENLYMEDVQLVSCSGGPTTAFCWSAHGASRGLVEPPPCFSCNDGLIQLKAPSYSALSSF